MKRFETSRSVIFNSVRQVGKLLEWSMHHTKKVTQKRLPYRVTFMVWCMDTSNYHYEVMEEGEEIREGRRRRRWRREEERMRNRWKRGENEKQMEERRE